MRHEAKTLAKPIGERLLTLREAADVLRLSTRTLRDYVQRGKVQGRIIGGRWRFRRADLDAFFESAPREWDFAGKRNDGDETVEGRKQVRGWHQQFLGFRARINCENIPVIPAWIVRNNLEDPRKSAYLLVWKDEWHGGEIKEAARLTCFLACGAENNHYVELKRQRLLALRWGPDLGELLPGCGVRDKEG